MSGSWDRTVLGISFAIILMALAVLVGWHAHVPAAIQVFQGLIAMQYNTALCFLALGAAALGLSPRRRLLLLSGGIVAALVGAAVVLEYATGISSGIDTLFFYPWEHTLSPDPGRMALTTAISFVLAGIALVVLAVRRGAYAAFGIVNSIPIGLALTSLVGYSFQITYVLPFSLGPQMALHTCAALLAYGIATLGYAWMHAERGPDGLPRWCAGIAVALLPVLLVGARGLFLEQSWRVVPLEVILAVGGVALVTLAVRGMATAKVAYKGFLMIAIPLTLLLIFAELVTHVKSQSEAARALAHHSTEVVGSSQSLLAQIEAAESAARGYVITGDETFAASYARSLELVAQTTAQLETLVSDNRLQGARAARLAQLATERTDRLSELVRLMKAGDKGRAEEKIKEAKGPDLMKQIGAELGVFSGEEGRLGAERRRILDASWQRLSWLVISGTTAAILLASLLGLVFSGGISKRLHRLRDNAIGLAAGEELALPLGGRDEIGELDRVFHEMAESLADVTRREKASRILEGRVIDDRHAEALRKTGALQSAILNSANFSSIATDAKGVIQIFNVGAERMLGYTAAEVMNRITPADLSDPQELIARASALSLEFATPIAPGFEALVFKASRGIEDIYELTYFRKDGRSFPAVVSVTALRDAQDAIIGYLLIGTDNTARKLAERAREASEARLSGIIASATDSIIAMDSTHRVTLFNSAAEKLFGRTSGEVLGRSLDLLIPPRFSSTHGDHAREFGETQIGTRSMGQQGAIFGLRKDGSEFPIEAAISQLEVNGEKLFTVMLRDVTERTRFEQALQQKNVELEEASRMKSEFLANMSHELRTPLNAIIGFSEVLRDGLVGEVSDPQRGFIGEIFSSGKHLLSLINEILDLSKVEAGKMTLDLESVQVSSLFANSLSIIREKAATHRIRLSMEPAEELGSIRLDARKVKQIVYNLLSNAVKFSSEEGQVVLRGDRVPRADVGRLSGSWTGRSLPLAENGFEEFLRISVTDSGIGISPEGLEQLFRPFTQIDSGLARKFEGTGLGLAMVKLLAELHGGAVAVESAVGEGSRFTVWLPLRGTAEVALAPARAPAAAYIEAQALALSGQLVRA